jgi:hypothetical protein
VLQVSGPHLDLIRVPYVLYGMKYIDTGSLATSPGASNQHGLPTTPKESTTRSKRSKATRAFHIDAQASRKNLIGKTWEKTKKDLTPSHAAGQQHEANQS